MFRLKHWIKCIKTGRLKGMGLVEALIVMIVLGLALWAFLNTAASSTTLHTRAKNEINMRILANSWFEVFESVDPVQLVDDSAMERAFDYVAGFLAPGHMGNYRDGYVVQGYKIRAAGDKNSDTIDGVRSVTLTFELDGRKQPYVIERKVSARPSYLVSDDKVGGA